MLAPQIWLQSYDKKVRNGHIFLFFKCFLILCVGFLTFFGGQAKGKIGLGRARGVLKNLGILSVLKILRILKILKILSTPSILSFLKKLSIPKVRNREIIKYIEPKSGRRRKIGIFLTLHQGTI